MPIQRTCEQCQTTFYVKPSHAAQRFCCGNCKTTHETAHGRPAAQVNLVHFQCKVCNAPFTMKPAYVRAYNKKWNKDPLYCSRKCGGIGRQITEEDWNRACIQCKKPMPIQRKPCGTLNRKKLLCSTACRSLFRRLNYQQRNPTQRITQRISKTGYVRIIVPGKDGKPSRDVFEHRYVMSKHLGRELLPEETVHHKNGNRQENGLENLELFNSRHGPGQRVADKVAFAIEMLRTYPEFARAAGVELHSINHETNTS